jgi:hypothetical protein
MTEPAGLQQLERSLGALGRDLGYPEPRGDLALAVGIRLREHERPAEPVRLRGFLGRGTELWRLRPVRPSWQALAAAAVSVAVLTSGILLFSPTARRAVAGWLGLRGVQIVVTSPSPPRPTASSTTSPTPPPPLGGNLDLGRPVTLSQALSLVPYRVLLPTVSELGSPDEVYVRFLQPNVEQVSLVYRARPGFPRAATTGAAVLVTEFQAAIDEQFLVKKILPGGGVTLQSVRVNGEPGFWIAGDLHEVLYLDANGESIVDSVRLAGNVLLWEQGDLTLRLESALTKSEALRIARSVR